MNSKLHKSTHKTTKFLLTAEKGDNGFATQSALVAKSVATGSRRLIWPTDVV